MAVDNNWIARVLAEYPTVSVIPVEGVGLPVPTVKSKSRNQWQGSVSDDLMPDSPNADSPEKIPFVILNRLTEAVKATTPLAEVLADDQKLAPLRPLFMFGTRGGTLIPVAFHVLAVKAVKRAVEARGFSEKTFLLLMRRRDGSLNLKLVQRFVEYFRSPLDQLDLAQRTVLEQVEPDWDPATKFLFSSPETTPMEPFIPEAGRLLQRDLETLLDASFSRADFFRYVNQLLALHLGLYQARLAAHLNPAMEVLLSELHRPGTQDPEKLAAIERGDSNDYQYAKSLVVQAPEGGATRRRVTADAPAVESYASLRKQLAMMHFNLIVLNRVREVVQAYLVHQGWEASDAREQARYPSSMVRRLQDDPDFRVYFERACEALAVRFALDQFGDLKHEDIRADLERSRTGLHALRALYQRYNRVSASRPSQSRAYKQREQVMRSLLSMGENGLLQMRGRDRVYLEIGAGLLPLLLMTCIGSRAEKIRVHELWERLGEYGFSLADEESERLLERLKAMGLYERFSDAGEASYVRNLFTIHGGA